jgi:hypothetical protein
MTPRGPVAALAGALLLAAPGGAAAQPAADPSRPVLDVTLYGWLQSLEGRVGAGPFSVPVSAGFRDVIDAADTVSALMGHVEYRRRGVGVFLDGVYTRLGFNEVPVAPAPARLTTSLFVLHLGGTVEVAGAADGRWALDALGGARFTQVRNGLSIPLGPSASQQATWAEPFLGLRLRGRLGARWEYALWGDIGGFGVGSDVSWQAVGTVSYRFPLFGADAALTAGYRALSQDYRADGFRYDMTVHGPVIGLNLRF